MGNVFLVIITTIIIAAISAGITFLITRRNNSKRYKNKVYELDTSKNSLINVKILSEITKVRDLVKTDNLKHKLEEWDGAFNYIKDTMIPSITDEISEVDFMIDRHDFKGAIKKITSILAIFFKFFIKTLDFL